MSKRLLTICASIAIGIVAVLSVPLVSYAQAPVPPGTPPPANRTVPTIGFTSCNTAWGTGENLGNVITFYICVANRYVTVIAVFIMIVVGIMYIIGGFKPDMAGTAKTIFATTVTGLIFMYLITFIINILAVRGIISTT